MKKTVSVLALLLCGACKPYSPTFADKREIYRADAKPLSALALAEFAIRADQPSVGLKLLDSSTADVEAAVALTKSHPAFSVEHPTDDLIALKIVPVSITNIRNSLRTAAESDGEMRKAQLDAADALFETLVDLEKALGASWMREATWAGTSASAEDFLIASLARCQYGECAFQDLDSDQQAALASAGFKYEAPPPQRAIVDAALASAAAIATPVPKVRIRTSGTAKERADAHAPDVMRVTEGESYVDGGRANGFVLLKDAPVTAWVAEGTVETASATP